MSVGCHEYKIGMWLGTTCHFGIQTNLNLSWERWEVREFCKLRAVGYLLEEETLVERESIKPRVGYN